MDDPRVRLFIWADSDGTLDLPKLVDEALEFLAEGCPLWAAPGQARRVATCGLTRMAPWKLVK